LLLGLSLGMKVDPHLDCDGAIGVVLGVEFSGHDLRS
jgi:hypothetical protein